MKDLTKDQIATIQKLKEVDFHELNKNERFNWIKTLEVIMNDARVCDKVGYTIKISYPVGKSYNIMNLYLEGEILELNHPVFFLFSYIDLQQAIHDCELLLKVKLKVVWDKVDIRVDIGKYVFIETCSIHTMIHTLNGVMIGFKYNSQN